jgi:hypothetical protein
MADSPDKKRPIGKLFFWGAFSLGLYALVFLNADAVQNYFGAGGVVRAGVIVAVAIIFSLVHGNFAGTFWDVVGIRAKKH